MLPQLCKNCEHVFQGNFCSNCGQKTKTVRLNWHYIQDEIKYTFLHLNKGLLYTAKQLFTRPGDTIREFIEGKRVHHYKPILMLFVLAGINGLLMHFFPAEKFIHNDPSSSLSESKKVEMIKKVMDLISSNYSLVELFLLPIYAFCSWLAFKKFGYNYIENIIINCYAASLRLMIGIAFFPVQYLLLNTPYLLPFSFFVTLPTYGYTIWLVVQLYKGKDLGNVILRMLLFIFLIALFFILLSIISMIIIVYFINTGYIDKAMFVN